MTTDTGDQQANKGTRVGDMRRPDRPLYMYVYARARRLLFSASRNRQTHDMAGHIQQFEPFLIHIII